jgi:hypothetical protein
MASNFGFVLFVLGITGVAAQAGPADETARLLERSRSVSLRYVQSLPDFLCTQEIRRFIELTRPKGWRLLDTLTVKLSYTDRKEDRKLILVNGAPANLEEESVGGLVNIGEFGGMLETIFDPATQTHFQWQSWQTVRDRPAAVYAYDVDRSHSFYMLRHGEHVASEGVVVAYRGLIAVDRETGEVLRLTYEAADIPKDFPMQSASVTVDYDLADAGGRMFLLPCRSETETAANGLKSRNVVEFRDYRKFTADSSIQFLSERQ